ncbi:DNA mismatch repair protein MSH5-like [Hibiscus syriacus]|uniref:DNA mismatch repair protein MSH5-like n=1 Tax=Hibiscus syriacus TaxID=106335 RepID=UPI0019220CAC|nr:DNA mismatch repair protein MSH5-like [Hibiscus syriacus]
MERAIIRDLVSHVLTFSTHLHKAMNFVSELDCLLSLAMVARHNNYDILCDGRQAYDSRTVHFYDRSTSSGNELRFMKWHVVIRDTDLYCRIVFFYDVLVCTHLTELFNKSCLPKSEKINFYTMSMLRPQENSTNVEDIIFLYRLVPGHAALSYGLHCALLAGMFRVYKTEFVAISSLFA